MENLKKKISEHGMSAETLGSRLLGDVKKENLCEVCGSFDHDDFPLIGRHS